MTNLNLLRNSIIILILIIDPFLIYSSMNGNASSQAITIEIELESQQYNEIYNLTYYYSNFSFSLESLKHYIFISSVEGNLSLGDNGSRILSLNSINHPPAIGLEPLEKFFIKFSSQPSNKTLLRTNLTINLFINFQLLVTEKNNLRKIVTKPAIFNSTTNKLEIIVPSGSVYFSTDYTTESSTSSLSSRLDLFFAMSLILITIFRVKNKFRN